jgi:hypothetical protein
MGLMHQAFFRIANSVFFAIVPTIPGEGPHCDCPLNHN